MQIENLKDYGFNTDNRTYIIAEIGINHGGNVDTAKKLIDSAASTGVDAVKFQTYITEKRVPEDASEVFKILKQCELPFEAFKKLKDYTAQYNLDFFSTPFDNESLAFLKSIGCNIYKVASIDVVNQVFLGNVAKTAETVILSTGMANIQEIQSAFNILKKEIDNIVLLHCISAYPTKEEDANLSVINYLQDNFDCVIGLSDHTNGIKVPLYAVCAGAQVIEKHFMIDENMECVDEPVSITEIQMKQMIKQIRNIEQIFGDGEIGAHRSEKGTLTFRRRT